ncbi:periplasmic binding protein/LacI transcriptional regulator [Pseudonocardia sp. Ae406_Ps2]|uniref:LacI family DNA-binding transcriptional regulator n=1 Tax=unclassified Pseudonocardia TaxID=2619320 RepID=UPI00094B701B|nr:MULTISPECIES: LacI family DNA-binding transcriptional regulator [unclassified Pseudonocardia]OLL97893.1 periplasmic binding protein/LacI transcriptional regulator [Pseudonocardia sp. Ae331_Ps2]OLM04398.1 periplasmic binding protein/LacI transcriptional regulator [Pseudonocardia sp. Ae406_Ps2]OLM10766.1 periplasmic binding protein/LacI transcriptional regulator [Pseudonocardia sp. Ae505_Ps2]OLM25960.1 periplasmic binding protein/LacI transcriptional regulator [Pseudonocardia sp. Ae706_Ps2]OL
MIRLEDVARAAGVSKSTASRALSRPDLVAAGTRERVQRLATEMGLSLNPAARALFTGRTGTIAMVVPSLTNPYFGPILAGAQRELSTAGGHSLISSAVDGDQEIELAGGLLGHADGVLLVAPRAPEDGLRELASRIPLAVIDRPVRGLPAFLADTPRGVGRLTEHLLGLGHRRIGYVGGPHGSSLDRLRVAAATRRVRTVGGRLDVVGSESPDLDTGLRLAARWPFADEVTAVVAYSSYIALGLLIGLREQGVDVPGRMSVAAVDHLAAVGGDDGSDPLLTALRVPLEELGRAAAAALAAVPHAPPGVTRIGTDLVPGRSTGPPH